MLTKKHLFFVEKKTGVLKQKKKISKNKKKVKKKCEKLDIFIWGPI